jgi:hypothetical protein
MTQGNEAAEMTPPEMATWKSRPHMPAWLMSLALHFTAFTVLSIVAAYDAPRGIADIEAAREAGIVLVHRSAKKTEYFSDEDAGSQAKIASAAQVATTEPTPFPQTAAPLIGAGPQLPTSSGAVVSSLPPSEAVPGTTGMTGLGSGLGRAGSGHDYDVETKVFGITGKGSRFVYVFDRSASMAGYEGRPLAAAKRELIASLQSLGNVHQFQIIFYNERPHVMSARGDSSPQMYFGNDQGRRQAEEFVRGVVADGGTRHLDALKIALQMHPDVIFFLTDADDPKLSASELQQISRANHGTTINAIEFGSGISAGRYNFLRAIADQNGGQYRYVDVTTLPRG